MKKPSLQQLFVEFIGTFLLAFGVGVSIAEHGFAIPTILVAGVILGTVVYTIGPISGAHINPAVTISLYSIGKITIRQAILYVIVQLLGGYCAMLLLSALIGSTGLVPVDSFKSAIGEIIGTFVLVWGVCSVVLGKVEAAASGLTIGSSLSIGIIIALSGSFGVLNPAVALGIGTISVVYILAPIVGGIIAAQVYRWVLK
ncbi:MAG TPA: aquaporin [Candidatus Peribacteraceae bacterium]|nr:aquaporin [Candidatus Peribacteraceae bacterium]